MLLSENREVVDALNRILESYDYLEYDEQSSKRLNGLRVKVTNLDADRNISVAGHICNALHEKTKRRFFVPGVVTQGAQNWATEWAWFDVQEQQYHKNVKITYPSDRSEPIEVECYAGEYMSLFVGDPQILQYADENGKIEIKFRVIERKTGKIISSELQNVTRE